MRAGWMTVMGRSSSLHHQSNCSFASAPFASLFFKTNVLFFVCSVCSQKCPTLDHACLSFPIIPLVSHSFSPDRSLGLALWHSLSHQMLIGHSGRVWEPENELLADYSLLCTLHQREETGEEKEGKWGSLNCRTSLWCVSFSEFQDIVSLPKKQKKSVFMKITISTIDCFSW